MEGRPEKWCDYGVVNENYYHQIPSQMQPEHNGLSGTPKRAEFDLCQRNSNLCDAAVENHLYPERNPDIFHPPRMVIDVLNENYYHS
jgi:hypothetical protein